MRPSETGADHREAAEAKVIYQITLPKHWRIHASYLAVLLTVTAATVWVVAYKPFQHRSANPFTLSLESSVQFPLYYPTALPAGFGIDYKSVKVPQQGVVIFNIVGPKNAVIYMSEEARPESFNLGGFYSKLLDLKEVPVSDGAVAVGRVANHPQTEIASRATDKTWILSNTNANIPFGELIHMLQLLALSH